MHRAFVVPALLFAAALASPPAARAAAPAPFADAVAVWHFGEPAPADAACPLKALKGAAAGIELAGDERVASLARGGDGRAAEIDGGGFDVGQGAGGRLNLRGHAMSMLLRLRNPSGTWQPGELFCKHGGHDRLVYNLFVNGDRLGFEFGADGRTGLAGQVAVPVDSLDPKEWHDLIATYDGSNVTLYVDGIAAARAPASGTLRQGNTEPVMIGRRGFKGRIDHAALWSRALSDAEIVALSGGEPALAARRAARARQIEEKIGREGLTLADQSRGARELRQRLWNDPYRPRWHLLPPDGFWNDINGTIFWKGRYHVFFLGRSAPDRDTILAGKDTELARETWLHASSRDLVHWVHHPPALVPVFDGSMPKGLFSGDMMNDMPVPTIIVHVPGQGTCLFTAEDDDLIRWKPHPSNPVIPATSAPPESVIFDPCGWKEGDTYYALVGNKNRTPGYGGDSSSLFRSRDLAHWEYRGPFYKSDRRWTDEIEDCACPDFFPLGDRHMLLMHTHRPYGQCQYYIGRYANERFTPEVHGRMTWPGGQLCAPETLRDDRGRRIFWGWMPEAQPRTNGWGSVASLPRVLSLAADGTLRIVPAPELETLRIHPRRHADLPLAEGREVRLDDVRGDCLELALVIEPGRAGEVGLKVRCSPGGEEQTEIVCSPADRTLRIECAPRKAQIAPFELQAGEPLRLRVFLDRSVLEVFANERQCLSQRIYPTRADSLGVVLFARGGAAKAASIEAWDLEQVNSW